MDPTRWERLLETCFKTGSDLLFVPGSPPLVRSGVDWQALRLPPLSAAEVKSLASDCMDTAQTVDASGFTCRDLSYGSAGDLTCFRIRAFAYPETALLLVSRIPDPNLRAGPAARSPN